MDEIKYTFDGKFEGNIMIVGRTKCGKTTFVQNLGKNKIFGDTSTVFWISKIFLSEEREEKIRESFEDQEVFNYPGNLGDFNYLLECFMQRKADYVNDKLGEDMALDKLIVMDDVSGLDDKSDVFSNFLTVSRKYGLSCVYIFHTIYPNRQNWEMIMSQNHTFNFFPGSVHNGTKWSDVKDLGPEKFRTQADNETRQICYYNRNKSDTSFNSFLAIRKQTSQKGAIKFSIDKVISNLNSSDVSYLELGDELKNINNDNIQSKLQQLGNGNIISRGTRDKNGDGQSKR